MMGRMIVVPAAASTSVIHARTPTTLRAPAVAKRSTWYAIAHGAQLGQDALAEAGGDVRLWAVGRPRAPTRRKGSGGRWHLE